MTADGLRLTVILQKRGPAAAIVLTDDQVAALGAPTKTPPVRFTIGSHTVEGRVGRMGGENLLGLNKSVRGQLGVDAGDTVDVVIEADLAPREIAVPPELARVLDADPSLRAAFDDMAPSRRKEHARSVADAKQEKTRERRIAAIVDALKAG